MTTNPLGAGPVTPNNRYLFGTRQSDMVEVPTSLLVALLKAVGGSIVLNHFEVMDSSHVEIEAYEHQDPWTVTVRIKPDGK